MLFTIYAFFKCYEGAYGCMDKIHQHLQTHIFESTPVSLLRIRKMYIGGNTLVQPPTLLLTSPIPPALRYTDSILKTLIDADFGFYLLRLRVNWVFGQFFDLRN